MRCHLRVSAGQEFVLCAFMIYDQHPRFFFVFFFFLLRFLRNAGGCVGQARRVPRSLIISLAC